MSDAKRRHGRNLASNAKTARISAERRKRRSKECTVLVIAEERIDRVTIAVKKKNGGISRLFDAADRS